MADDTRSGYGASDWEDTTRKALLQEVERVEAGAGGEGAEDENGVTDPSDVENLKAALKQVTTAWRNRTQGQRWTERGDDRKDGPKAQWRCDLAELLEATWTHVFIVFLLVIDLAATAIDILKTIHSKSHDLDVCIELVEKCTTCVGHFERSPEWKWTYWTSIVILSILMLNVVGLIVANGMSFFRNPLYLLDLIVVSTALALEIALDADTAGLIIVLTLWRIVRVAHGIFEVTDEAWEKNIHELESQVKAVQEAHDKDQELLREKDRRISELECRFGDSNDDMSSRYE